MTGERPQELSLDFDDTARLVLLAETHPVVAADLLDSLATRLHEAAKALREGATPDTVSYGTARDRCRMKVIGPDGETKATAGTADNWSKGDEE